MNISRIDFKNYCLRKLGAPVMQINVESQQIEDCIDDALQKFWEFHGDGNIREYFVKTITPEDRSTKSIEVPDWILSVVRVLSLGSVGSSLNLEYVSFVTSVFGNGRIFATDTLTSYTVGMSYLSMINEMFTRAKIIRFNYKYGRIFIDTAWETISDGDSIVFECYRIVDPDDAPKVWNDPWLKAYATALIKRQWGQNMIKYDGFQLPSGITLNGRDMYGDALQDIEKLESDLITTYSLPVDFFMG